MKEKQFIRVGLRNFLIDIMEIIDSFLNRTTMYRLTLYYLIVLVAAAFIFCVLGIINQNALDILFCTFIALTVGYFSNIIFSKIFHAVTNIESVFITALILVLIIPVKFPENIYFFIGASLFAMAAKYFPTIEKQHIFNPAAAGVAAVSLLWPSHVATWWVGTPIMVPFVLIGGLLLIRKIRKENMVFDFVTAYFIIIAIAALTHNFTLSSVQSIIKSSIIYSPFLFFSFVMFTEPITSPTTKKWQSYYSYFVALLYSTPQVRILGLGFTPEISLCLGNLFSFLVSPKYRLVLKLSNKFQNSPDIFSFVFTFKEKFNFIPGQYMEWTLPHKQTDDRGNRRYFSIASSPTENFLMVTVRFNKLSSSYKNTLFNLPVGSEIIASSLSGDFVLPRSLKRPIVFIAGGVGIAPFRSMAKYIIDKKINCNIILFYVNKNVKDIIFSDTFENARQFGLKTVYTLTDENSIPSGWTGKVGRISEKHILEITDYKKGIYYISGPQLMVQSTEKMLHSLGINNKNIITDFFPGYLEKN